MSNATECDRCDGTGEIDGAIEIVECPNCRDVCQWCNNPYDDGEPLGDTGFVVCRTCIRDMARFKEDDVFALYLSTAVGDHTDADALWKELDTALKQTFAEHGLEARNPDGCIVRNSEGET